jgi:nucleoredoxin
MEWARPLGVRLFDQEGSEVSTDELEGCIVALYFADIRSRECRDFTPTLLRFYEEIVQRDLLFEVVFVSFDASEATFQDHFAREHGNWIAVEYSQAQFVSRRFGVRSNDLPALFIVDSTGEVVDRHAHASVDFATGACAETCRSLCCDLSLKIFSEWQELSGSTDTSGSVERSRLAGSLMMVPRLPASQDNGVDKTKLALSVCLHCVLLVVQIWTLREQSMYQSTNLEKPVSVESRVGDDDSSFSLGCRALWVTISAYIFLSLAELILSYLFWASAGIPAAIASMKHHALLLFLTVLVQQFFAVFVLVLARGNDIGCTTSVYSVLLLSFLFHMAHLCFIAPSRIVRDGSAHAAAGTEGATTSAASDVGDTVTLVSAR